jgi:hypothetical protein
VLLGHICPMTASQARTIIALASFGVVCGVALAIGGVAVGWAIAGFAALTMVVGIIVILRTRPPR